MVPARLTSQQGLAERRSWHAVRLEALASLCPASSNYPPDPSYFKASVFVSYYADVSGVYRL